MDKAIRVKVWINYGRVASSWCPESIKVMRPKVKLEHFPYCSDLSTYFHQTAEFIFNGSVISLLSDEQTITALSSNFLKSLGMEANKPSQSVEQFYQKFFLNLIEENLWLSFLFKSGWGTFNRTGRLTATIMAVSLISLGNIVFSDFENELAESVIIGPVQFSPSQMVISITQGVAVGIPVYILMYSLHVTVPFSLAKYEFTSYTNYSTFLRIDIV